MTTTTVVDEVSLPPAAHQGGSSEGTGGVSILSTLLLSVLLKLEDREHRIPPTPRNQQESSSGLRKKWAEGTEVLTQTSMSDALEYDSDETDQDVDLIDWVLLCKEDIGTEVLPDGDAVPSRHGYATPPEHESTDAFHSSPFSSIESERSVDKAAKTTRSLEKEGAPATQDIILTSEMGSGDTTTPHPSPSVYQESAVRIVSEALLRAIANIFINGVVRRSLRAVDETPGGVTVRDESWSLSTNVSNGNEDDDEVKQESGDYYGVKITDETPTLVSSEDRRQAKPNKASAISPDWLMDVNRQIAANQVAVGLAAMIPPSVASSCNVSRCSSVSLLSSGDRTLNVKATPPSQSKLLWKMMQKTHSGSSVLKTLLEETEKQSDDSQNDVEESPETKGYVHDPYHLTTEKATLRAKLSVVYTPSATEEISLENHREVLPTEGEALFCESETQTRDVNFERTDDLEERGATKEEIASSEVGAEVPQPQTKARGLPPSASPLLMDVVWRHASHPSFNSQEMIDLKASYVRGSYHERQQAQGVVKFALRRAVSSLLVHKVISDSMASISSTESSQIDLRYTSSFNEAVSDLPVSSLQGFQWFPYQEGDPAGPNKVATLRRGRQGDERTQEGASHPTAVDKQQSSQLPDTYVDAIDKFGSSDDLLTKDVKGHTTSSDDDEFTDAVCEVECPHPIKTKTSDKSIQVSDIGSPSQEDDQKTESVQLELPMESINFIKGQLYDVKALVDKYRDMLYEPSPVYDIRGESAAQPETDLKSKQKADHSKDDRKIAGRQSLEEVDNEMGELLSKKVVLKQKSQYRKKDETGEPSTSTSSQVTPKIKKCDTSEENEADISSSPEIVHVESIYIESSSEDLESTPKYKPRVEADKRGGKRKRKDISPAKNKTMTPRKLRKGTGKLRTPAGRSGKVTGIREKTTPDGFLPTSGKRKSKNSPRYPKNQHKTPPKSRKHTVKSPRKQSAPPPKAKEESSSLESVPKIKHRISFFEKISRHRISARDDTATRSTDSTPKLNMPVTKAVPDFEKVEIISTKTAKQKPRVQKQKDDKDTDGKKHLRDKLHGSKKDEREPRDGAIVDDKKSTESGVDNSPGRGIWTNAAFFEALKKSEEPKTEERLPSRERFQKDGLLKGHVDGENEPTTEDKHRPRDMDKQITNDQASRTGTKEAVESSTTALSETKKRLRNKNANNQLLSPDDSCISSSLASDAKMDKRANGDVLPFSERNECSEANEIEEPYLTAQEETCDEGVSPPFQGFRCEDRQMYLGRLNTEGQAEGSQSTLAIEEKKTPLEKSQLPQKSSSERFSSLKVKTSDQYLNTKIAIGPFHSSCDSIHPTTPKRTSRKAAEEVQNTAVDKPLAREGEQDLDQKSSFGDLTKKTESNTDSADLDLSNLLNPQEHPEMAVVSKLSDESQDKERLPSILLCEGDEIQSEELQAEEDQFCPLSSSKDLDDIGSLRNLLTPLSTSSPRSATSSLSSGGTCSINGDRGLTGITDSAPETDEVHRSLRNASFLRACNHDDYLDPDAEDHFVTCDDADDDEVPGYLQDGARALKKHAEILTDTSYYTDAASQENIAGVQVVDSPGKESSDGKRQKKKRWRFKFFRKRKEKREERKRRALAAKEAKTPSSLRDEKQQHSPTVTNIEEKKQRAVAAKELESREQTSTPANLPDEKQQHSPTVINGEEKKQRASADKEAKTPDNLPDEKQQHSLTVTNREEEKHRASAAKEFEAGERTLTPDNLPDEKQQHSLTFTNREEEKHRASAAKEFEAGERTLTPVNLPDSSTVTNEDAVAVETVTKEHDKPEKPVKIRLSQVPAKKRKLFLALMRRSKKHKPPKNS